ncbi:MAG: adenosine-specific kinase [Bacteroidota bacterium]
MDFPEDCNVIIGQSHFIKTVEDIYETIVTSVPGMKFGLAFNEASGPCLVRKEGNDEELIDIAVKNALNIGAGHIFILIIKNGYPINILNALKNIQEVCRIFAATANPLQILTAETEQGKAVIGVVDGYSPKGEEKKEDIVKRKEFLREITGYKR